MTTNRSSEELQMREQVEAWGRRRWPQARLVHELVVDTCRIDMAFICPDNLIGIELKSSKDVLDRLPKQIECFRAHIPEVWVALAPKWVEHFRYAGYVGRLIVSPTKCAESIAAPADDPNNRLYLAWPCPAKTIRTITTPMLRILWHRELTAIAIRKRTFTGKGRLTCMHLMDDLARKLTGDEIVAEVCRELRARDALWKADPPCVS